MLVHIFEATSSPSITDYALRMAAKNSKHDFPPESTDSLRRDLYVDGLLKSFSNPVEAINTSKEIHEALF